VFNGIWLHGKNTLSADSILLVKGMSVRAGVRSQIIEFDLTVIRSTYRHSSDSTKQLVGIFYHALNVCGVGLFPVHANQAGFHFFSRITSLLPRGTIL
jgi:hypothetical protein